MEPGKSSHSIKYGGNINTTYFQPTEISGNNNKVNVAISTSSSPNLPIVIGGPEREPSELEKKLRRKLQTMESDGVENPGKELFLTKITNFCNETTNPDQLADHLLEKKVLNPYQWDEIRNKTLKYDKNVILYDKVLNKRDVIPLLDALQKSGNENVLKIIEELVEER